jgi:UPF0755 protein
MTKPNLARLIIMLLIVSYLGFLSYTQYIIPPNNSPSGTFSFEIKNGMGVDEIGNVLASKNIVPSSLALQSTRLFTDINSLKPGQYKLNVPATVSSIATQLSNRSREIGSAPARLRNTIKITFPEGYSADQIANVLTNNGINGNKFLQYITTPHPEDLYTNITPPLLPCQYGSSGCAKYYYEGYLFPSTYNFFTDSTESEILNIFINGFNSQIVSAGYFGSPDDVIIASMVEKEAGGSRINRSAAAVQKERATIASVFRNRLDNGMKLQSNPTLSYGVSYKVCEQTMDITDCRALDDNVFATKYNTYRVAGLPIGPIANAGELSFKAVHEKLETDYLFFVADLNGVTYFAKTEGEHYQNIAKVQNINASIAK